MAQHNPQSRAYLIIVMAAIVVCFVIAQLILGGGDSETHTAADPDDHTTEASAPAHEAMSKEEMPPRTQMGGVEMGDDVSPPDEMPDETSLDAKPENNP